MGTPLEKRRDDEEGSVLDRIPQLDVMSMKVVS